MSHPITISAAQQHVARIAEQRMAHGVRCDDDATEHEERQIAVEMAEMDRQMTTAAETILAMPSLDRRDLVALARVLRHFAEETEHGIFLDERPIVERSLARLLDQLAPQLDS